MYSLCFNDLIVTQYYTTHQPYIFFIFKQYIKYVYSHVKSSLYLFLVPFYLSCLNSLYNI